jgi:hypothetical protein
MRRLGVGKHCVQVAHRERPNDSIGIQRMGRLVLLDCAFGLRSEDSIDAEVRQGKACVNYGLLDLPYGRPLTPNH